MSEPEIILWSTPLADVCACSRLSYLSPGAPGWFAVLSSAGGTCADQSRAAVDTDKSCCLPETRA